jgi:hypothetical protein
MDTDDTSMGGNYVFELLPTMGLFFVPQIIYEYGEQQWNNTDRRNPKNSERILFQWHQVTACSLSRPRAYLSVTNTQGYFCDETRQNAVPEVLSQKHASRSRVLEHFLLGFDITNTSTSLTKF